MVAIEFLRKHRKGVRMALVVMVLAILAVSIYNIVLKMTYSAKVNIIVAPSTAEVLIGGKSYGRGATGEHLIPPGNYEVVVSAEGFTSRTGQLVTAAGETAQIQIYLEPVEGNLGWYEERPEDALLLGEIKNYYTVRAIEKLTDENPILKKLPYEVDYYTADFSQRVKYTITYELNEDDTGFSLVVLDYTGGNLERARKWILEQGAQGEIEYVDKTEDYAGGYAG